jgi:hypothetical protein
MRCFARLAGLNAGHLTRILNDKREISRIALEKLQDGLALTVQKTIIKPRHMEESCSDDGFSSAI